MRRSGSPFLLSAGLVAVTLVRRAPFAPALAPVVDDAALAALPEPARAFYAPLEGQQGKHALSIDGIDNHPAVAGLKAKNSELLGSVASLKTQAKKYEGVDPEKYAALTAAAAKAEEDQQRAAGNFDALKAQLIDQHTKALDAEKTTATKYQTALDKVLRSDAARAVLGADDVGGNAELLLPHILPQTKVVEEDGEFVVRVVDGKGNPRIKDASGTPMTLKDLALEMRANATFAGAFKGTGMSGGNAAGGTGGNAPVTGALKGKALREASIKVKSETLRTLVAKHSGDTDKAQADYTALLTAE